MAAEIREFLRAGGRFDFAGLLDPRKELSQARIEGAALDPTQIREILLVADRADEWNAVLRNPPNAMRGPEGANSVWPAIARLCSGLADFTDLLRSFRNKINPDGTLDDHASPDLARIRREIEKQRRTIRESLNRYLRNLSEGGTLQEELVTIRGERFVIPVKVEQKRRVQGVVHGVSSSGQTVFVEPLETIEQNNELDPAAGRRTRRSPSHFAGDDAQARRTCARYCACDGCARRVGIAVREGALRE